VFAEFETNLRRERQLEGIAKAKAAGVYAGKGRPVSVPAEKIIDLKAQGLGPSAIAKALCISRMSVHRVLKSTRDA
jgi:DNA invertase Pin-like site-specific DNA recombinase